MKFKPALFLLLFAVFISFGAVYAESDENEFKPQVFEIDGKEYNAYILKVDMKDMRNFVDIGIANDKIGTTQDLREIAINEEEKSPDDKVLGAINGTFFNMQVNTSPINTIMKDGKLKYAGTWASLATFDGDNSMSVTRPVFKVMGSINDQWDFPYGFTAKYVNKFPVEQYGVAVVDSSFSGKMPDEPKYVVRVEDGIVTGIFDDMVDIPKNGYLLVARVKFTLSDIKVGDSVDYQYKTFNIEDQSEMLSFYNVRTALGAGPTLVKDGTINIDLEKEGFQGWSLYNDRQRSMIGMTADKVLYLVVCDSISLDKLSKLALKLNMKEAMNLDGGGSAGLVVDGKYAFKPDRKVSNAIIIKQRKEAPIRIVINQVEHFFDTDPYIYKSRTMVPLRGIVEALGFKVEWNNDSEEIKLSRYGKEIVFRKNSTEVRGTKRNYQMDVPLLIRDGRSAISVRFLSEFLGGEVKWDNDKKLVKIQVENAKELYEIARQLQLSEKYDEALQYYDKTLQLNGNHIAALKYSGEIFKNVLRDYRQAAHYLERMLALYEDKRASYDLGHTYIAGGNIDACLTLIDKMAKLGYDDSEFYLIAARCYKNIDHSKAKEYYGKLLNKADADFDIKKEAKEFIN